MRFQFSNSQRDLAELVENSLRIDFTASQFVKSDLTIKAFDRKFDRSRISLIEFYLGVKDSLSESFFRMVPSPIRENFEDILLLTPNHAGCIVTEARPPYPTSIDDISHEQITLNDVREAIEDIENEIRYVCSDDRRFLFDLFDKTQSRVLFDILRVLDRSCIVRS